MTPMKKGRKWCAHIEWMDELNVWRSLYIKDKLANRGEDDICQIILEYETKCPVCGAPRPKGER